MYANTPTPDIVDSGRITRARHETVNKRFKQWGYLGPYQLLGRRHPDGSQ